jgi:hypothetical protein
VIGQRLAYLGAHGGARGFNPFPAPRRSRCSATGSNEGVELKYPHLYKEIVHGTRSNGAKVVTIVRKDKERKTLVINTELQPWQKHAAKLHKRAVSHLGWNERREARESRKALEVQFSGMQP